MPWGLLCYRESSGCHWRFLKSVGLRHSSHAVEFTVFLCAGLWTLTDAYSRVATTIGEFQEQSGLILHVTFHFRNVSLAAAVWGMNQKGLRVETEIKDGGGLDCGTVVDPESHDGCQCCGKAEFMGLRNHFSGKRLPCKFGSNTI